MRISELLEYIETWAPMATQESWDNSGLICGEAGDEVTRALLCLDCTTEVLEEAASTGCDLVICHHPPVFKALKRFSRADPAARIILQALGKGISILALHTNLDHAPDGVSQEMALRLGLKDIRVLSTLKNSLLKLQVFCPESHSEQVRSALFNAGAGELQGYFECSFSSAGSATFLPGHQSRPFAGEPGKLYQGQEIKLEVMLPAWRKAAVETALLASHPYEVPAFEFLLTENELRDFGAGVFGFLPEPMEAQEFLKLVAGSLQAEVVRHTRPVGNMIHKVALCGGSGSFLLEDAIRQDCQALVTADFKYHQFFDADNKILVADVGHYESEQFTPVLISRKLSIKFPNFALQLSKLNTNPIQYYHHGING